MIVSVRLSHIFVTMKNIYLLNYDKKRGLRKKHVFGYLIPSLFYMFTLVKLRKVS